MNAPEMRSNALQPSQATCEECGGPYARTRRWQRFCGARCRNEFHRKQALGQDGRLAELEQRVAALESRVKVLDEPLR